MKLVNNWKRAYKSLAVILPTLAVFIDAAMQTNLIPEQWLPVVVFVSGFIGRIIKQPKLGVK